MPNRNQQQDRAGQSQAQNPGAFSPDDDEAQEADVTRAAPGDLEEQQNEDGEEMEDEEDGLRAS